MAEHRSVLRTLASNLATACLLVFLGLGLLSLCGCGGSGGSSDEAAQLTVTEVAPELAVFGDLAAIEASPVSADFDSAGGELDLADGATINVPAGAFDDRTSLTVTIVGLALSYFDSRLGPARTYAIETDRDYSTLAEPVILEIPFPTEVSAVAMLNDGEWAEVEVSPGDTTRVEISHFSKTLITFLPAGIEWLVEKGWMLGKWTNWGIPGAFAIGVQEELHRDWVKKRADQSTRDFYGLDEDGDYVPPTHTQEEMCEELQTVIAEYTDSSLPKGYSGHRLGRYLADASDPGQQNQWPEFWNYTRDSMAAINRQVLDSNAPLTPAQVLKIAIEANGGNVPMGLLAAHNYLKNLAYLGREFADPGKLDDNKMPVAPRPVPLLTGQPVAHLEPWRQESAANPSGRLDKMGSLYHIFAAAVAAAWGYEWVNSGEVAAAGEAILRAGLGIFAGDVPDRDKGLADECGARLGGAVLARAAGQVPSAAAGPHSGADQPPDSGPDGATPGGDDGSDPSGGEDAGSADQQDAAEQSVESFNGTYVGTEIWRHVPVGTGPVKETLESVARVEIRDGAVRGMAVNTDVVEQVRTWQGNVFVRERCQQTMSFTGTIDKDGVIIGEGTSKTVYELISFEPADFPGGVRATTSPPEGFPITVSGRVNNGYLEVELQWSGQTRYKFDGKRP